MNRRELLQQLTRITGGAVVAPSMLALLAACSAQAKPNPPNAAAAQPVIDWKPQFFDPAQALIVTSVAQILIPKTDTPGAIEAGVPAFIDRAFKNTYAPADQDRYRKGIEEFDAASREAYGKGFSEASDSQRAALVQKIHDAAFAETQSDKRTLVQNFMLATTELTKLGFFTSPPGATEVLQFLAIPGKFEACIPLAQAGNGKTWAE